MKLNLVAASIGIVVLFDLGHALAADPQRQAEVAARGAEVMPFQLSATQHVFTKTANGGLQQVIVKNPADAEQIKLIRGHLAEIAAQFQRGDFSGPSQTHGAQMPGLSKLKAAKPGQIVVSYTDMNAGGQIEYSSKDPHLIAAIHEWFDAQLSDHGADAMEGHHMDHDSVAHP
jgi:hypothetical protein